MPIMVQISQTLQEDQEYCAKRSANNTATFPEKN